MSDRKGDWIQTYTGHQFWPVDPRPGDIFIEDIAHALSLQCRFAGHLKEFYSVAHHSLMVADIVEKAGADCLHVLQALLHDAAEAYLVDVPRPIKPFLSEYKTLENRVMDAVCKCFNLPQPFPDMIKWADNVALETERRDLMGDPQNWIRYAEPHKEKIYVLPQWITEKNFLDRFNFLTKKIS